jgi:hypothetical protein
VREEVAELPRAEGTLITGPPSQQDQDDGTARELAGERDGLAFGRRQREGRRLLADLRRGAEAAVQRGWSVEWPRTASIFPVVTRMR